MDIKELTEELYHAIMKQREHILEAFIAETGLKPSECEQVVGYSKKDDGVV